MATAVLTPVVPSAPLGLAGAGNEFNSMLQEWNMSEGLDDFLSPDVTPELPLKESPDESDSLSASSAMMDETPSSSASFPLAAPEIGSEPFELVYLSLDHGHIFDEEAQEKELRESQAESQDTEAPFLFSPVKQEPIDSSVSPRTRRDRVLKGSLFEVKEETKGDGQEFLFDRKVNQDEDDEDFDEYGVRNFPTPSNILASKLSIGDWAWSSVEVKFMYGRRKIKYYVKGLSGDTQMMIDFDFSQIACFKVDCDKKILKIELSSLPNFIEKVSGRWVRATDFTQGNATMYRQHKITVPPAVFDKHILNLLQYDPQLRALTEASSISSSPGPTFKTNLCDWDTENTASVHCDDCGANYCDDCDEILHRHPEKKLHKRCIFSSSIKKSAKRKKKARCRCGTGATKGTLGSPCTGNRCPCFSEGRKCTNCGCKNCTNPHNK